MLDGIIRYALNHRGTVLLFSAFLLIIGGWKVVSLPVDVFPDLNRPTVTILTESHGLAPEEVETLVTYPIERVVNGMPGVMRVRSSSGIGISVVYVEFEWGTDIYLNRQLITERLQLIKGELPEGIIPTMSPISSIMGEIQYIGIVSPNGSVDPMKLRTIADWIVRPRLMTVPGISQVAVMGGEAKQYHILISSDKLLSRGISLEDLQHSLQELSDNTTGGFLNLDKKEFLIRTLGRVESIEDIENTVVGLHFGRPVFVKDVATVKIGAKIKRGEGGVNAKPAVVINVKKQPGSNTLVLTEKIDLMLTQMQATLPDDVKIEKELFKQATFIEAAISNVKEALRDGALMVALIIFLFLLNFRTTFITLMAIPLSLIVAGLAFTALGLSINTMTLGGLAIAIGEVVDDAIVDVENVFRRLRENKLLAAPLHPLVVVYKASAEIRNSIVLATVIVVLVFIPLFALEGIEGRMFAPLGVAYIIALLASLFVALTVTPVMCYLLLPGAKTTQREPGKLVKMVQRIGEVVITKAIRNPYSVLIGCSLLLVGAVSLLPLMGRNFMPEFNEGSATIGVGSAPGISLPASNALGRRVEAAILTVPEVKSTVRRTGRAEQDEHASGVNWSEIDVDFKKSGRSKHEVLEEIRAKLDTFEGLFYNVGQPISHRLDHLQSGIRAQVAIKIFGPDMGELRMVGGEVREAIKEIPGLVDLQLENLVLVPQLKISIDREAAAKWGLSAGRVARDLEMALNGESVSQFIEDQRFFNVYARFDDNSRQSRAKIEKTIIKFMPNGQRVTVGDIASVYEGTGPNMTNRENLQRRIVVSANSAGRDLDGLIRDIKAKIEADVEMPEGYFLTYGGQFESERKASRALLVLGSISILGIFLLLLLNFKSGFLSLQIMLNVPLALIGSVVAIFMTERVLSVATLIAFITLCGIATRNGILMISHYLHLMKEDDEPFTESMIIKGSLDRLIPVLMTAFSAILALVPLLFSKGAPGKEILYPVAVVIIGGLMSSTLLDILVTPAVFYKFGRKSAENYIDRKRSVKLGSAGELL